MSEPKVSESVEFSVATPPSALLKQARIAKNLTEEDIAAKLHLRVAVVKQMEAETELESASKVYLRGYMRNYAKLLGLNSDIVPEVVAFKEAAVRSAASGSVKLGLLVGAVVVIAAVGWAISLLLGN
ncbi:helix-turn-helix domain-containing protein [Pelagibaculum spongiae]|uniref:Helix-turn-helix domain-containing protein n=1 Tax=Pelagibaculum spongiae TaxID=2080658 RepID=A0A2V1GZ56_9GAMM|nr:helix-turn-helix transcriptional regulator [Pelagibaculum spongiae]PVZ72334.1 hypothetical protein DC094_04825 [Pelagibaculum spongiae]